MVGIWSVVWDVVLWLVVDDEIVGCTLVDGVVELGAGLGTTTDVGSTEAVVSDSAVVSTACVAVSDSTVGWTKVVEAWTAVVTAGAVLGWASGVVSLCTCSVDGGASVDVGVVEGGIGVTGASAEVGSAEVGIAEAGVVAVGVVGVVEGTTTAVDNIFSAAARPSAISLSETGFSSSLHPVCIGIRRSEPTLERPSEQDNSMHDSTSSSRPSLEATHMSFW